MAMERERGGKCNFREEEIVRLSRGGRREGRQERERERDRVRERERETEREGERERDYYPRDRPDRRSTKGGWGREGEREGVEMQHPPLQYRPYRVRLQWIISRVRMVN